MKYLLGDILVDFDKREFFVSRDLDYSKGRNPLRIRLATPGEKIIFEREFKNCDCVLFSEFKLKMPVFDARQIRGVIYGHIIEDEATFLFFRAWKTKYNCFTTEDKLQELIFFYLQSIKHNKESNPHETENARRVLQLFNELKALINE